MGTRTPAPIARSEPRGLAVVEVADDAPALTLGVATVDREQRDVDAERLERRPPCRRSGSCRRRDRCARLRGRRRTRRSGRVRPDSVLAEPVRVVHGHAVTRGNRAYRQAADVDRIAGLHPDDAIRRHARLGDHVDDGGRDDERRAGRGVRDGADAGHVQMVDVLVRAEHDVDADGLLRAQRRVVEPSRCTGRGTGRRAR